MERKRDVGARMDELVRGADWAEMGRNSDFVLSVDNIRSNKKPRVSGAFLRLRD